MSKMAASETVRLRLQFDYPPPATPHCTVFWLLVDLNTCRVVTDLISLIRQRFGFSSGALLGLYLEGGLLPPAESARLVRDNDCLRVKLEDGGFPENVIVSNGDDSHFLPRKAKKRAFKLVEDEEMELGSKCSKKHWKNQEDSGHSEKALGLETKYVPDEMGRAKSRRKSKVMGSPAEEEAEAKKNSSKRKEKCERKKQTKASKSLKTQVPKEWSPQNCSSPRGSPRGSPQGSPKGSPKCSPKSSLTKARRKSSAGPKGSPGYLSELDSCPESVGDGHCNVTVRGVTFSEKLSAELLKDGPATKTAAANRQASKPGFSFSSGKGKAARTSSSSSDSTSESEDHFKVSKNISEGASDFLKATGLFAGQGCPGLMLQTPGVTGWKPDSSRGRQTPGPPPSVPTSLGRGWGRGEHFLFGKGLRGRGVQGRGRGRSHAVSCILNRSSESQKQKQLSDILTNSSIVIQNPVETHKNDYSLLPQLAAAPQVGEKIAFKLLELTSDYSPDVSDYKEGKILSHNPETQQVDIEILSSLPVLKEPGKFDLVYHNENGTEVVEYAVTQERKISVLWKDLIDPRLIIDPPK